MGSEPAYLSASCVTSGDALELLGTSVLSSIEGDNNNNIIVVTLYGKWVHKNRVKKAQQIIAGSFSEQIQMFNSLQELCLS